MQYNIGDNMKTEMFLILYFSTYLLKVSVLYYFWNGVPSSSYNPISQVSD